MCISDADKPSWVSGIEVGREDVMCGDFLEYFLWVFFFFFLFFFFWLNPRVGNGRVFFFFFLTVEEEEEDPE